MKQAVLEKVFEHARVVDEWCAKNGGIRVMTALFGSQNYNLNSENSDVDTKSIIVPELGDWTWGDLGKYNKTLVLENGEHAETKNITDMCKQYMKGNINFLETLYTEYVDIAPGWEWLYDSFLSVRNAVSHFNVRKMAECWLGYEYQALERAFYSTSKALGYQEDVGYNPKSLMNAFRIKESFIRFFEFNRPFDEAIDMTEMRSSLLDIKTNPMPRDIAMVYGKDLTKWLNKEDEWVKQNLKDQDTFNAGIYFRGLCELVYVKLGKAEWDACG